MSTFSESQLQDLRDLQHVGRDLGTESVIIGAMAYRLFIADADRETYDIDLAVALDLDDFKRFEEALVALGWRPAKMQEQRWVTPHGNRLDLVPAGQSLRKQGKLVWPQSGFVMSLAGFDHVFQHSVSRDVGNGLLYKVIPPPILALLKISSYTDNPGGRAKDLTDFRRLMRQYEEGSERIFSDVVFEAALPDVECASAFLLGLDLRALATDADASLVESFIAQMADSEESIPRSAAIEDDWTTRDARTFQQQLASFAKGFKEV